MVRMIVVVALTLTAGHALAQHVPESEKYRISTQGGQQPLPPPQPTGYWEKTWGAIATSETGGALGTAIGLSGKAEAGRAALADCQSKGGEGCRVDLIYHNQCAAMVLGDGFLRLYGAGSVDEASEWGLQECNAKYADCRVYYSACTKPIFHKY